MNTEKFVYVTFIATTPEALWQALTQGELTRQYWKHDNVSDWKAGSSWTSYGLDASRPPKIQGQVLESIPNKRLVLTWSDPSEPLARNGHSRVSMEIEPFDGMVRLTVTHEELTQEMLKRITWGWPRVLSSLKSLLETGRPLDPFAGNDSTCTPSARA